MKAPFLVDSDSLEPSPFWFRIVDPLADALACIVCGIFMRTNVVDMVAHVLNELEFLADRIAFACAPCNFRKGDKYES